MKSLVACFSASGTTSSLAKRFSKEIESDYFEIEPVEKYTTADLDWNDSNSRCNKEMNDKSFRPAIANKVDNMDQYDVIYIGFPIWWYVAPTIVNTFLESYDFSGKTIVPFATSGSSGYGKSNDELVDSCKGADLKPGIRVASNDVNSLVEYAKKVL